MLPSIGKGTKGKTSYSFLHADLWLTVTSDTTPTRNSWQTQTIRMAHVIIGVVKHVSYLHPTQHGTTTLDGSTTCTTLMAAKATKWTLTGVCLTTKPT